MRGNKNHPLNIETSEHRERKCSVASLTFSLLGVYQNSTVQCGQIGEIEKNTVYHLLGVTDEFCDVCGGVWWMPLMRNGVVEGRMEPQVVSKLHFKKCSYINCGVTSRNTTDGTSFHTFPIKDHDRCITWLVNCGLDDWVVENDSFFKHKYVCSRHFSKDCKHASGRLTKSAVPNLYDHDNNLESTTSHTTEIDVQALMKENNFLKKRLLEAEKTIEQEKIRYENLLSRYRTKCEQSEKRKKV